MAVQNIPVVDLRDWNAGGEARDRFVRAVGESLADIGFFAVQHHGVPDELTRRAYGAAREFFHLPAEIKARYPSYTSDSGREMDPISFLTFFQSQPWVDGRGVQVILPPANAADFSRYYNEGLIAFVLGQKPLDDASWTEFLNGLDSLGAVEYEASAKQALIDAGLLK